jgi:anti-sigma factor RsiW
MMCRDVVEAMTDATEGALSGWKKASYHLHLTTCPFCRRHRRQVETTIHTLKGLPAPAVDEGARERALAAFRRKHSL